MGTISTAKRDYSLSRTILIGTFILLPTLSLFGSPVAIPTPTKEAVEYHQVSNIVWGINQFLALLLLPLVSLIAGSSPRIPAKLKHGRYWASIVYATTFFTLSWVIRLPLDRLRANDLDKITNEAGLPVMQWVLGQFTQAIPTMVLSGSATLLIFWLINRSPSKWWLWTTSVFSLLTLVFLVLEPYTISHQPLGQTPIEAKIVSLAEQIGVPSDSIALEECEPFNSCEIAHVTGLGPTRLILLNKGLFNAYPESWALQTFAHESKHYLTDDNLVGWIVLTLIFVAFFFSLDRVCKTMIKSWSKRLGFTSLGQPAAFPLLILVLNIMYLLALPPINTFRQHVEFEADRYGLEFTHENQVLAEMVSSWTTESRYRVPDPSIFFMLFRSSHPSDAARISFANEFQPTINSE